MDDRAVMLKKSAKAVLAFSRRKLAAELPAFLCATYLLSEEATEEPTPLYTDGLTLYYHPETVVKTYLADKHGIATQLLHILLHGLLGHFDKRRGQDAALFDAAADFKVFCLLMDLHYSRRPRGLPSQVHARVRADKDKSLEHCYLAPKTKRDKAALLQDAAPLYSDRHDAWEQQSGQAGQAAACKSVWAQAAQQVAMAISNGGHGHLAGSLCAEYGPVKASAVVSAVAPPTCLFPHTGFVSFVQIKLIRSSESSPRAVCSW